MQFNGLQFAANGLKQTFANPRHHCRGQTLHGDGFVAGSVPIPQHGLLTSDLWLPTSNRRHPLSVFPRRFHHSRFKIHCSSPQVANDEGLASIRTRLAHEGEKLRSTRGETHLDWTAVSNFFRFRACPNLIVCRKLRNKSFWMSFRSRWSGRRIIRVFSRCSGGIIISKGSSRWGSGSIYYVATWRGQDSKRTKATLADFHEELGLEHHRRAFALVNSNESCVLEAS